MSSTNYELFVIFLRFFTESKFRYEDKIEALKEETLRAMIKAQEGKNSGNDTSNKLDEDDTSLVTMKDLARYYPTKNTTPPVFDHIVIGSTHGCMESYTSNLEFVIETSDFENNFNPLQVRNHREML